MLTQLVRFLTYNAVTVLAVLWIAVLLTCILIVAQVYGFGSEIGSMAQTLWAAYLADPTSVSVVKFLKPYVESYGWFSVIVFIVGLLFHKIFRNKKFLTLKQSLLVASVPTLIAFIFIAVHIDDLLQLQNSAATMAQLLVLIVGIITVTALCGLILFTRLSDSVIKQIEKTEFRVENG